MKPITHLSRLAPLALSVALTTAMTAPLTAAPDNLPGAGLASVTYGPYLRAEFGMATTDINDGSWQPHGYPSDPQVNFDLSGEDGSFGTVAMGFDWMNGYRFDLGMTFSESMSVSGPCASASDGSDCATHADITSATLDTSALMGSLYYSPLEAPAKTPPSIRLSSSGLALPTTKSESGPGPMTACRPGLIAALRATVPPAWPTPWALAPVGRSPNPANGPSSWKPAIATIILAQLRVAAPRLMVDSLRSPR
ncbi:hypothetical protein [Roseobacter sp. TSBP12]|uniref:hypothetical protein n=1 Tax=Roseobacter sp. TSBP12 TaxID=1236613 RepID=UPI00125EA66C|nr:hypothetical protein [Roseobacter sp. TSBP12]